nr:hypothetical protein [Tanacetum cinerariifolium]
MNFKGTKGVVGLTQWFERMETVFNISKCAVENQVKFSTCTLHGVALTWWKSHVKTVGHNVAYGVPWNTLMKTMTAKYYPQNEIKKLEMEIWGLKVKESDKIEKYVGGLPDMIHGSVTASKPKTMQDAVEFVIRMMDKKICTFAELQTKNKKKQDDNQQQQNKRQNTGRAYTAGLGGKIHMVDLSHCAQNVTITMMVCVLPNATNATELAIWPVTVGFLQMPILLTTKRALGWEWQCSSISVCGGKCKTNPDSNVVTGTFLLNNRYASIIFDTGTDRSFVSTAFSSLIDITPTTLDYYYDVELVDEKIIRINTIIRGCTLNFLNHPFNIELMLVELGSFDVIIGMDWLEKYHVVIVCAEKIVRITWGNESLIVHGDRSD